MEKINSELVLDSKIPLTIPVKPSEINIRLLSPPKPIIKKSIFTKIYEAITNKLYLSSSIYLFPVIIVLILIFYIVFSSRHTAIIKSNPKFHDIVKALERLSSKQESLELEIQQLKMMLKEQSLVSQT